MQKVLLPLFYLPPISWFSVFSNENNQITFEQFEHFPKQTYRNRTCIFGANGKLPLIINNILKINKEFSLTEEYIKSPEEKDFREYFSAKKEPETPQEEYYQTFSDKLGFIKDLSILDLLCNIGPESHSYLRKS